MGEIVDDVRAADVLRGRHREIVLSEPDEELPQVSAVSGDRVLARIAGLQAVQVPGECRRECCWDLHRAYPPSVIYSEYACFSALWQTRHFACFDSYNQGVFVFY